MNYLSAENISKYIGDRTLFENLSFGISKGEKIAFIAPNGAGKTTILRILAGQKTADSGSVLKREGINIGYLEQEPRLDNSITINELINGSHSEVLAIIRAYEKALKQQTENYNELTQKTFEEASAKMDEVKGWDYELRMKQMLSRFNITQLDQQIGTLSGGEKKRLALALVLLDEPDLLILDEPTNHLDIDMIEWLEKFLSQSNVSLLMVTHDRYFLDRICNHIFELADGKLYHHKGNYAYYLEKSFEREVVEKTEIEKAKKLMRKELDWMRRMPKARTTKSKARIDSFYKTQDKAYSGTVKKELKLEVKTARIGGKILELEGISKAYGDINIIKNFDYIFKKGERIGIIGKNGIGKSSFLNILTEKEKADKGTVIKGETIKMGYFTQTGIQLNEEKGVLEALKEIAEVIIMADGSVITASQLLEQFMFPPKVQHSKIESLSGGERRRLHLLTVLIKNPNFLILDEPTNDLDLLTLNKLEEFLEGFKGCLILVSHDRYFLDKLVDHLFIFEGKGKLKDFYGKYTEYKNNKDEVDRIEKGKKAIEKKTEIANKKSQEIKVKTKLTFKEQKEFEQLEKDIKSLENEKKTMEEILNSGSQDYQELQTTSDRISEIIKLLDDKEMRWLELSEYL